MEDPKVNHTNQPNTTVVNANPPGSAATPTTNSDKTSFNSVKKPSRKIKYLAFSLIVLLILVGSSGLYYKQYSTRKFNALANQLKQQEITNTKNYVTISDQVYNVEVAHNATLKSSDSTNLDALKSKIATLSVKVDKTCGEQSSSVSEEQVTNTTKHLWLSGSQKSFITKKGEIQKSLESTQYSSNMACSDGKLIVSLFQNFANYAKGLNALTQLSRSSAPTNSQLNSLKEFTTYNIIGESDLRATLPQTTKALDDLQSVLENSYYAIAAQKQNRLGDAINYAKKIASAANNLEKDQANIEKELISLDDKRNKANTSASLTELALQDTFKANNFNDVESAIPVIRIIDTAISDYSDSHKGKYPDASNINELVTILKDKNLDSLKSKNLLDHFTYSRVGGSNPGFSLSGALKDGTVLTIKYLSAS